MIGSALLCLSLNVYHESRGEPEMGQIAVAQVTLNRAADNPKNVCEVVFQPGQFSWTVGAKNKNGAIRPGVIPKTGDDSWERAKKIAQDVLAKKHKDVTKGASHYHERHVKPKWTKKMVQVAQIGHHIFYRDKA